MPIELLGFVESPQVIDIAGGGRVILRRRWLQSSESASILDRLRNELTWEQREMRMFGRTVKQPRLTAWWGDSGASYAYSGISNEPRPWPEWMTALRRRIEHATGARYNSCLGNFYRDGNDYLSMHADDEPELGPRPTIASLSLGATRWFKLRHDSARGVDLALEDGDLLVMSGPMQREWKHGVPKMARVTESRVNLTFRWVESQ